jgi:hypothetical protein
VLCSVVEKSRLRPANGIDHDAENADGQQAQQHDGAYAHGADGTTGRCIGHVVGRHELGTHGRAQVRVRQGLVVKRHVTRVGAHHHHVALTLDGVHGFQGDQGGPHTGVRTGVHPDRTVVHTNGAVVAGIVLSRIGRFERGAGRGLVPLFSGLRCLVALECGRTGTGLAGRTKSRLLTGRFAGLRRRHTGRIGVGFVGGRFAGVRVARFACRGLFGRAAKSRLLGCRAGRRFGRLEPARTAGTGPGRAGRPVRRRPAGAEGRPAAVRFGVGLVHGQKDGIGQAGKRYMLDAGDAERKDECGDDGDDKKV